MWLSILIQGCATDPVVINYVREIPDVLLKPCENIELRYQTNGELLESLVTLNAQYRICKLRMDSLIEYYRDVQTTHFPSE